ncbi:SPOR domain-containing protein [Ramlibacter sp.]|uniref:SPOR domain-containing protein n=1 Tax=Ramlibacter sp. TaxID=1917967 RepID=UPI002C47433F|nr:SPOR domain-containing protein [Ramlibacter sp.]HWI82270.1 SPOR domain-containing protein [Ramlibacter sp.]
MAFFKFRTAADGAPAARQPESVEAMRRRARHRLIGATVLVLAGVVGFPLLFDTQPRPIPVDIPIEIPDRHKAKPLPAPARATAPAPVASGRVSAPPAPAATVPAAPVVPAPAAKTESPPAKAEAAPAKAEARTEPKPESKAEAKPESKAEAKPVAKAEPAGDGAKAKALLEGKPAAREAAAEGRFVVQVGAFADVAKAREARARLERAGLKTYTHVAETRDGRRIRVRVGPFASKAEADKAAHKIKGLDLPAAILTL